MTRLLAMLAFLLSLTALASAPRKFVAPATGPVIVKPAAASSASTSAALAAVNDSTMMEPTEFVDQDVRDVLRAIARAYNLNIFPYPDVKGKVTVSLHRMPVMDALRLIVQPLGYELSWENSAWVVRPEQLRTQGAMEMGRGNVTLTFRNKDLQDFAEEYARRTGLNILVDRNAHGTITGTLRGVEPLDGLKAILTANGFEVRQQGDTWIVSAIDVQSQNNMRAAMGNGQRGRVDLQVRKGLVTANLRQSQINDVVQTLADQSGYNMITYGQLGGTIDANLKSVPVLQALSLILQGTPFTYAIKDSILLIGDRNPGSASGQALSQSEIYYLKYMRVDKVMPLLPKNLPAQAMQAVTELNALLLSGTGEMNDKVKEFLQTIDRPIPQVVLEAVIVEFYKSKNTQMGIKAGNPSTTSPVTGPAIMLKGSAGTGANDVVKTTLGDMTTTVGLLPQDFLFQLDALENSDKGRVLARPRLTTLNGQAASINVGTSDYFQVSTTNTNGVVSSDYRAFNTGITLAITPYLTKSGQITAEIKPEVRTPRSTSASSSSSTESTKPPGTSTRSLQTNVSLKDGETIVLGGLMQTLDLENIQGVPLLSAIPILGKLFTYHTRSYETTELAIFITPHVLVPDDPTPLDRTKVVDEMNKRVNGWKWNPFARETLMPPTAEDAVKAKAAPKANPTDTAKTDSVNKSAEPDSAPKAVKPGSEPVPESRTIVPVVVPAAQEGDAVPVPAAPKPDATPPEQNATQGTPILPTLRNRR